MVEKWFGMSKVIFIASGRGGRLERGMGMVNAIFGTASAIDPEKLEREFTPLLIDGEEIVGAFKLYRDLIVFTQVRVVFVNKQGVTGKKVDYYSLPYKSVTGFSVETAGRFDLDSELKIWVTGFAQPIKKEFKKGTDILEIQRLLAHYILNAGTH